MTPEADRVVRANGRIGTVLRTKYRLDSVLGFGGMAVVYAATHRNAKRFAVKMLHPELSHNSEIRARFLREGYAANSVEHAGTVSVLDDDIAEDGSAFLVMELLDGAGVDALWENHGGRMPVRTAVSIVCQLLDVLSAAHARGIIHRDIKPANLFVTRGGMVKVLDFGIARVRDAAISDVRGIFGTGTGMLLGTPAFMAPEQALATSSDIDARTDVWGASATLFTLLSGRLVHDGKNAQQLLFLVASQHARPLASAAPHVPPAIARVVDRGLAFGREVRWPSAATMRDALRDAHWATFGVFPGLAAPLDNDDNDAGALLRPRVGDTTVQPISASGPAIGQILKRLAIPFAIGCVLVVCMAVTGWSLHASRSSSGPVSMGSRSSTPYTTRISPAPAATVAPETEQTSTPTVAVTDLPRVTPTFPLVTSANRRAAAVPAPPISNSAASPSAATTPLPNCNTPFHIERNGHLSFKNECL